MVEEIIGILLGTGFGLFFLGIMLIGLIDFLGKIYVTYLALVRDDLTIEQILIYLLLAWLVPYGWIIYLLLGEERTRETFSELKFIRK